VANQRGANQHREMLKGNVFDSFKALQQKISLTLWYQVVLPVAPMGPCRIRLPILGIT